MISHLAAVEFRDDVPPQRVDDLIALIAALPGHIDLVRSMSVGRATSAAGEPLHKLGLAATFDSLADLATYSAHPKHLEVGVLVKELSSAVWGVDFES